MMQHPPEEKEGEIKENGEGCQRMIKDSAVEILYILNEVGCCLLNSFVLWLNSAIIRRVIIRKCPF